MTSEQIFFVSFIVFVVFVLILDLTVIGRKSHEVSVREAAIWSGIWILLALVFAAFIRYFGEYVHGIENVDDLRTKVELYMPYLTLDYSDYQGSLEIYRKSSSIDFLSGYLIEKSLSVDNLFVIMAILTAFSVKKSDYKTVLFWGILGAIVMRFIFIFAGAALIYRFEWLLYIFGLYLIYMGVKMYRERNDEVKIEPRNHPIMKLVAQAFYVFPRYVSSRFIIRRKGKWHITPLLIVLIFVEFIDLIFALDSIPAIFAVTRDPFIVFFSNIFAILGLRSLFFLLIKVVEKFYLLKVGVAFLLVYVGAKLMLHEYLEHIGFRPAYSLFVILFVLVASVVLSLVFPKKEKHSIA